MKTSELVKYLVGSLAENGDLPVYVIFNGKIDDNPGVTVSDDTVYIEGVLA